MKKYLNYFLFLLLNIFISIDDLHLAYVITSKYLYYSIFSHNNRFFDVLSLLIGDTFFCGSTPKGRISKG